MIEDPLDRIIDEIHDHMSEHPARLPDFTQSERSVRKSGIEFRFF